MRSSPSTAWSGDMIGKTIILYGLGRVEGVVSLAVVELASLRSTGPVVILFGLRGVLLGLCVP
jgi:hypothetical protein